MDSSSDMQISLYHIRKGENDFYLDAGISDGCLEISGQDLGPFVRETWGDDDYEYWYRFDAANTRRLFELIAPEAITSEEMLAALKEHLYDLHCMADLRELCDSNDVEYSFSNYA